MHGNHLKDIDLVHYIGGLEKLRIALCCQCSYSYQAMCGRTKEKYCKKESL